MLSRGLLTFGWLRGQDSNLRPLGYEPNELPLLHPAPFNRIPSTAAFHLDLQEDDPPGSGIYPDPADRCQTNRCAPMWVKSSAD